MNSTRSAVVQTATYIRSKSWSLVVRPIPQKVTVYDDLRDGMLRVVLIQAGRDDALGRMPGAIFVWIIKSAW